MNADHALHAYCRAITFARETGDDDARKHAEWNVEGLAEMCGLRLATSVLLRGFPLELDSEG